MQTIHHKGVKYMTHGGITVYTGKADVQSIRPKDVLFMDGGRATHKLIEKEFIELVPQVPLRYLDSLFLDQAIGYDYWGYIDLEPIPTRLVKPYIADECYLVESVCCAYNKTQYFCVFPGSTTGRWWHRDQLEFITDFSTIVDEQLIELVVGLLDE